ASPRLSIAMLDAPDGAESLRLYGRLCNTSRSFLRWPLNSEPPVKPVAGISEHAVFSWNIPRENALAGNAPLWTAVREFIDSFALAAPRIDESGPQIRGATSLPRAGVDEFPNGSSHDEMDEIVDLPPGVSDSAALVSAAVRGARDLVEAPVRPPMSSHAILSVDRGRRLVMIAVASDGLDDLTTIADALRWTNENRTLISMAVPQLNIDAHQLAHLRLLVNRADFDGQKLQPLLQSGNVTLVTCRKVRWSGRTGLLMEAA
ncbi:MAG: hypothetical protein ACREJC_04600, partial [Tepidisphaeraceae bacterium]